MQRWFNDAICVLTMPNNKHADCTPHSLGLLQHNTRVLSLSLFLSISYEELGINKLMVGWDRVQTREMPPTLFQRLAVLRCPARPTFFNENNPDVLIAFILYVFPRRSSSVFSTKHPRCSISLDSSVGRALDCSSKNKLSSCRWFDSGSGEISLLSKFTRHHKFDAPGIICWRGDTTPLSLSTAHSHHAPTQEREHFGKAFVIL